MSVDNVLIVRHSLFIHRQLSGREEQKRGSVTHDELLQLESNGSKFKYHNVNTTQMLLVLFVRIQAAISV